MTEICFSQFIYLCIFFIWHYYEKRKEADKGNLFVDIRAWIIMIYPVSWAAQLLNVDTLGVCPLCERLACLFTCQFFFSFFAVVLIIALCQFFSYFAVVLIIAYHLFISVSNAISDKELRISST